MVTTQPRINRFIDRVRSEYLEMPGLALTTPQLRRFLGADIATCDVVLAILEGEKFLQHTSTDAYVLRREREFDRRRHFTPGEHVRPLHGTVGFEEPMTMA